MKHLLATALLATCALFLLPGAPTFAFDSSYRAKAMAFLAQDIADARRSGSNPKVFLDLVDLNGDGIPEALARIESQYSCGSHGCAAYVLDLSGPAARSIGDFIAFSLKVLPTKTGAWRDVSLDGTKQVFQAGKYVSVAKAPVAAEEPRKHYCGIVHDYVDSHQIMDGKFNPYWDHSDIQPPRDPYGAYQRFRFSLLLDGKCACVDGAVKAFDRGGERAYAFTDILAVKICDTKSVPH